MLTQMRLVFQIDQSSVHEVNLHMCYANKRKKK